MLLKVDPGKEYQISEERLRFPVQGDVPPNMVPFVILPDLRKAIDIFEKHRKWKLIDAVPQRKEFPGGKPCCADIMSKKPGESLTIVFEPSNFQGDTDDAHNFGEISNPEKRLLVENIIDWVAIMHFWVPTIGINMDAERDHRASLSYEQGFTPLEALTPYLQQKLKEKYPNG